VSLVRRIISADDVPLASSRLEPVDQQIHKHCHPQVFIYRRDAVAASQSAWCGVVVNWLSRPLIFSKAHRRRELEGAEGGDGE